MIVPSQLALKTHMCRQPRNVRQTNKHISTTYRQYRHLANCDGAIIYNNPVLRKIHYLEFISHFILSLELATKP
jgi:hypothetical protein